MMKDVSSIDTALFKLQQCPQFSTDLHLENVVACFSSDLQSQNGCLCISFHCRVKVTC